MAFKGLSGLTAKSENENYPYEYEVNKSLKFLFTESAHKLLEKHSYKMLITIEGYGKFWFFKI